MGARCSAAFRCRSRWCRSALRRRAAPSRRPRAPRHARGLRCCAWTGEGHPFVTDGGHLILDAALGRIPDPKATGIAPCGDSRSGRTWAVHRPRADRRHSRRRRRADHRGLRVDTMDGEKHMHIRSRSRLAALFGLALLGRAARARAGADARGIGRRPRDAGRQRRPRLLRSGRPGRDRECQELVPADQSQSVARTQRGRRPCCTRISIQAQRSDHERRAHFRRAFHRAGTQGASPHSTRPRSGRRCVKEEPAAIEEASNRAGLGEYVLRGRHGAFPRRRCARRVTSCESPWRPHPTSICSSSAPAPAACGRRGSPPAMARG